METHKNQKLTILATPSAAKTTGASKVARALEIRKSASKAREGKPLAFPTRRMRP